MQYAILCYESADDFARRGDVGYRGAHAEFLEALCEAGVARASVVGGAGLKPPHTATTLRKRGGARLVVDGPYADIKEQLGGVYLIDVADLDAALAWAERCPTSSTGAVEVRPLLYPAA